MESIGFKPKVMLLNPDAVPTIFNYGAKKEKKKIVRGAFEKRHIQVLNKLLDTHVLPSEVNIEVELPTSSTLDKSETEITAILHENCHDSSVQTSTEGVKTEKSENDHINLKVAGQDGSVVQFKIKQHTPLSKLMKAYCDRQGLSLRQIRFRFDGQPINETDTPAQLEMEDEDTIDVFQQQTGGVC
nr:PREDICTED: small ubiquitin-related modifier 3 isoform X1 [Latimeria chalumnae]|eukprot:XP_014344935.1 PREDICTED: small ubiquitin-related modifier 3 isoform X1 [Latimeria chalumnae]